MSYEGRLERDVERKHDHAEGGHRLHGLSIYVVLLLQYFHLVADGMAEAGSVFCGALNLISAMRHIK